MREDDAHTGGDQDHHVHDHNHKSALMHVLDDALTSMTAIIALVVGKYYSAIWLDPLMGIVGALVILRWAYVLCRDTGKAKGITVCSTELKI